LQTMRKNPCSGRVARLVVLAKHSVTVFYHFL
jgi:hypothetical protein